MAATAARIVATEPVKNFFRIIEHYILYAWNYKRNIRSLEEEIVKINHRRETIERDVPTAINNAKDIRPDVEGWVRTSQEYEREGGDLLERTNDGKSSFLCCNVPNVCFRYSVSKEASERTMDDLSPRPEALWICGMPGSGKTILAKRIAEEVKSSSKRLFDEVAMAVVSQDANINKIQDDLASRLGLSDIEMRTNVVVRAELLYNRLMGNEGKRTLIILDDLWEELDLHKKTRVNVIVDELKDCHLLLVGEEEGYVKLHDVVRDVCLSVANKENQNYMVMHGGLNEWPENCELCTCISLTVNNLEKSPPALNYPKLRLLRLDFENERADEVDISRLSIRGMKSYVCSRSSQNPSFPFFTLQSYQLKNIVF
ncbi:hypothetical protein Leryth_026962 [Lithospermum erythrorhizon]|nr:hypothetical protein Leryth_026962 [Lithospermum erythrorhizon]